MRPRVYLGPRQRDVLDSLRRAAMTIHDLERELGVQRSIWVVVQRLVVKGCVTREDGVGGFRSATYSITAKGRAELARREAVGLHPGVASPVKYKLGR